MNDLRHDRRGAEPLDDAALGALIARAGARPAPPEAETAALRAAAQKEWARVHGELNAGRSRRWIPLAAAAVLAVAGVSGWVVWRDTSEPAIPVGIVESARGGAHALESRDGELVSRELTQGAAVSTADRIATAVDAVSLTIRLGSGSSLRLDADSEVALLAPGRFRLERGALYVDSESGSQHGAPVVIDTPFGIVREIGTRFEVRLRSADQLVVRVRSGQVRLEGKAGRQQVERGEELLVHRDGSAERRSVDDHDSAWLWTADRTATFALDGATLAAFFDWWSGTTGCTVKYESEALRRRAEETRLHGAIEGFSPEQGFEVVAASVALRFESRGAELLIRAIGEQPSELEIQPH